MGLQIGFDDFGKVRTGGLNFVDKTKFIKEVIDNKNIEVCVIVRPRRFGKTFNLSTLRYFLAEQVNRQKTSNLFDGLKISAVDNGKYMQYQGKYPVIFVSFKDIKSENFESAYEKIRLLVAKVFGEHDYLAHSDRLSDSDRDMVLRILNKTADKTEIEDSLYFLTSVLFKHHGTKAWLLIDEYDTPIQAGYLHNYYKEIVELMRGMFSAALKSNQNLERSVITGILRVAKESLFSGLNNVRVFSLLQTDFGEHFGFTEEEIRDLLKQANLSDKENDIRKWYNGYIFGNTTVYNPWSIVNCLRDGGMLRPYWVNTSDNILIKNLLIKSNVEFKEQFELLLQDKTIAKVIDENMVFGDLRNNGDTAAWSLLLMSGYLKVFSSTINERGNTVCECAIPNWEVRTLYCNIIELWLGDGNGIDWYQNFLSYLLVGNIGKFAENFGQVLAQTISVYDVAHNPEAFYHGFMLGLIAGLDQKQYEIRSNRESGDGRYDIAIIPKDTKKNAIIFEIKSVLPPKVPKSKLPDALEKILTKEAQEALEQINRKQYVLELVQRGFENIVKIGLAFSGKEFDIQFEGGVIRFLN